MFRLSRFKYVGGKKEKGLTKRCESRKETKTYITFSRGYYKSKRLNKV